jgi:LPXTG-site transpeptidase (sortase) family protein
LCLLLLFVAGAVVQPQSSAYALTTLTVEPLTWNVIGLDSNNVSVGPNHFPIGARVCNSGVEAATNVTAAFVWDSADPYIALRPGTLSSMNLGTLNAGACADAYFEVEITRNSSAYDHTRDYHISVTAGNISGAISTPTPREVYVEHLISQNRNAVSDMLYGTSTASLVSVPNGGTMMLMVGNTYFIRLVGSTATQGYEQIESFVNFPNTIFQILSVDATYSAESSSTLNPPYDSLYGDACAWENDPDSPNYQACLSTGKAGGNITVTYEVKILQVPSAPLVNPEPLSTLIYDFSGSSFHYNADYGTSTRYANIVNAGITKSFSPKTINPGSPSTLTFTINNPGTAAMTDVNFTDDLPAGMTLANNSVTYSGCGAAVPATVSDPMSFSNITVAGLGTCTIAVTVTAASDGIYNNTSGNLFIGTTNTGSTASDTLAVSSQPPMPLSCTNRSTLATWTLENYTASATINSGPFSASSLPGTGVTAGVGTFVAAAGSTSAIANPTTYPDAPPNDWGNNLEPSTTGNSGNSWGINTGWPAANPADPVTATASYFQFRVDGASNYGGIGIAANYNLKGNWSNSGNWYVLFSPDGTTWSSPTGGTGVWDKTNAWQVGGITTNTTTTSPTVYFRVYAAGAQNSTATMYLDSINITGCSLPAVPNLSKSFSGPSIKRGSTSTLTFTLTNPNTTTALSGVSFTDVLPAGLTVASASTTACNTGTLTTSAPRTISLSGGTINASGTCTINVTVTGATAGSYTNVSSSVSSAETGPNTTATGYGTSSITVVDPPVIAKSFNANPIFTGDTTALDFDIVNPNTSTALTGVTFTDVLPAGLSVANGTFSVCGGTDNLTTDAATRAITLLNTTTFAAGGTCSFSVMVTGSTPGSYTNTTGSISSTNGGTGNTAVANVLVKTPAPVINLMKQVGSTASGPWTSFLTATIGSDVYYRFMVENTGDVSLSNVSVDDPTVSTTGCSWTRGDSATPVTSPFTLPVADAANNQIATCILGPIAAVSGLHTNTATASGTSGSTVTKSSSATYGTPEITIAKSVTQTSFSAVDDILDYSYLVTNSGGAPLLGPVTVSDDKATVTCPAVSTVGDNDAWFDVGESLTCMASYKVLAADVTAGSVTNTASATVSGVTSNTDSETVNGTTDLAITKNDGVTSVNAGGTTTYTIRVTNNGPSGVTGAILSDPAVAGLTKTAVACSSTPGECVTAPNITQLESGSFALPTLANGDFYEITVAATVDAASGSVTNTATVASPAGGNDPDLTNNTASDIDTVTPAADLTVTKTNNTTNGRVTTGTTFQWTFTIKNSAAAGPATFEAGDTILSDTLPANASYGLIIMGGGIFGPTDCVINSGILTCTANGASVIIPPDGEITVSFNVTPTGTANLVNTAAVVDPDNQVPESDELNNTGSNTVYLFDAEPSKLLVTTSEPSTSGSRVTIGEMVRYRIAARIPEGDFANFQLVDNIPSGLQFVNDGTARFAFVSNDGGVMSSTLTCTNDTGNAYDVVSLPSANVDCALTGAMSGGTGNGVAVTFSLGNLSNADTDVDAEYAVVEFNALVLNVTSAVNPTINQGTNNQTGANVVNNRQNDVTLRVNNTTVGINSANVTVNIAEPAITDVLKSVSVGPYSPGDPITYTLTFSNVASTNTNAATAFDIVLTDSLDANLTPGTVNVSSTQTSPCIGGTVFTTSTSTSGQDVTANVSCLDPDESVTVTIDATIDVATAGGTNISNTGNVTYSSLPGAQGSCSTSPFTCTGTGGSGSGTGERNGSNGAGVDTSVLNNYSDSGTVSFTVTSTDLLPIAALDTNTATENGSAASGNVLTNETSLGDIPTTVTAADQGGSAITIGIPFATSAGGSLTLNADGTYSYTPPATLPEGGVLTEVFNYTITDVDGDTSSSTLTITIDRLPQANPDTATATEGGANATGNVITNDDEGNTSANVTAADQGGAAITIGSAFTTVGGGTLTLNANGTYDYTPPAINLVPPGGLIEVLNYTITDNDGDTSSSTLTITVNDSDRLPDAVADTNTATEGGANATGNVLTNENSLGDMPTTVTTVVDDDGDPLTLGIAFATDGGGSLTINADGTYTYTPPAINLVPPAGLVEVFTYTITDVDGDPDTTTLTITVNDSDRLPVATNNSYTINAGATASGNVMTDGTADTLGDPPTTVTGYAATSVNGGTVTVTANGAFTYDPNGYVGTDTFTYTITDVDGDTSTATVTITVNQSLIGVAKRVVSSTEVSPGTYDVTYEIYVENFGTTVLNNIEVEENLSTTFSMPTTFTVLSVTSPDFARNASYNGSGNTNLLTGSDNLAVGASGNITLVVRVVPASGLPFTNIARASGQCPTCTTRVNDDSQDGSDPDPDNDNDPTDNNDPTPLTFGPNLFDPPFGLKVMDASGLPVLQWTMVWINDSNIVAINAQVSDPISAGTSYAGGLTCVASGVITTTTTCTYEAPSVTYPRGRVIWIGNLGPDLGATDAASATNEITITFNVNVDSGITSVQNNATADYDGNGDGDFLDAGEQIVATARANWSAQSQSSRLATTLLPATGFAPNVVTDISNVPSEKYMATGDVTVEIPSLMVKIPVVGVPKKDGAWNVSWLGNQAGWLEGSAFPSWSGNSVLTGHVYLSSGLPGPFISLGKLKYGDKIIIHAYGQKYTFEVRTNEVVEPSDKSAMKHEEKAWLTLITCKEYDEKTNTYRKRIVVRAVLVNVTGE